MSRRRKRIRGHEEVNLNLAAMLDMAFQLLAFFILTFRPNPAEAELKLKLPPPDCVVPGIAMPDPGMKGIDDNDPVGGTTLAITIVASPGGQVASISVGLAKLLDGPLEPVRLRQFDRRLKDVFAINAAPFDQVLLRVGKSLDYGELMKIVDVCTRQKMADGTPVSKISFVELEEK